MKTNCIGLLDSEVVSNLLANTKEPVMGLSTQTHEISIEKILSIGLIRVTHKGSGKSTVYHLDSCDAQGLHLKDDTIIVISKTIIDDNEFAVLNVWQLDENSTELLKDSCHLMEEELGAYPAFCNAEDGHLYCIVREESLVRIG